MVVIHNRHIGGRFGPLPAELVEQELVALRGHDDGILDVRHERVREIEREEEARCGEWGGEYRPPSSSAAPSLDATITGAEDRLKLRLFGKVRGLHLLETRSDRAQRRPADRVGRRSRSRDLGRFLWAIT